MERLQFKVERFLSFFENKVESIEKTQFYGEQDTYLFKKILYAGMLDTLAKTVSSKRFNQSQRFQRLVESFADWENCKKISVTHLIRLLEKVPDQEFNDLRRHVHLKKKEWPIMVKVPLDKDLEYNEVFKLWPRNIEKPFENISIVNLSHSYLLYKHRCTMVHELREPGYGFEFEDDQEPFYHSRDGGDSKPYGWELVYPVNFYRQVVLNVIKNLGGYFMDNGIDPYNSYTYGTFWLEELNWG